jgi:nicotinate-nucleotide--dimethylbenzimidazole phosphoribosyltransferase
MDARFPASDREAVYRAIRERRDVRAFRPDPVAPEALRRLLEAAHQAPSVGRMQPWNFVFVEDRGLRQAIYDHFRGVNEAAAQHHGGDRQAAYAALKLQGILDAPVNLLVTCDRSRGGPHVLGRATMREMDLYSTCLAVQNLWLAARAEGLGVGWMSLMEPGWVAERLGLPEEVVPVAYLCVGHPVELPPTPLLGRVGWREALPLEALVFADRWGVPRPLAPPVEPPASSSPAPTLPVVLHPADERAPVAAGEAAGLASRFERLPTPPGALGRLEELALRLARIQGRPRPMLARPWIVVMAADHGVAQAAGVSAYRPEATALMVYRFLSGCGVVNALAREAGAGLVVADLGVDQDFTGADALVHAKVARGTRDMRREAAMTEAELAAALAAGRAIVEGLGRCDVLVPGELGIGNTTASAALLAGLLGLPAEAVAGAGSGVGPQGLSRKRAAIAQALALHGEAAAGDPDEALRRLGGLELAGLVGAIEAAAEAHVPVLLDGFIVGVAALLAEARRPGVRDVMIAASLSPEPAHVHVLERLGLVPLLDWGLRLGEGSAAALALPLLRAACRVTHEVATYEEANVDEPLAAGGRL